MIHKDKLPKKIIFNLGQQEVNKVINAVDKSQISETLVNSINDIRSIQTYRNIYDNKLYKPICEIIDNALKDCVDNPDDIKRLFRYYENLEIRYYYDKQTFRVKVILHPRSVLPDKITEIITTTTDNGMIKTVASNYSIDRLHIATSSQFLESYDGSDSKLLKNIKKIRIIPTKVYINRFSFDTL